MRKGEKLPEQEWHRARCEEGLAKGLGALIRGRRLKGPCPFAKERRLICEAPDNEKKMIAAAHPTSCFD